MLGRGVSRNRICRSLWTSRNQEVTQGALPARNTFPLYALSLPGAEADGELKSPSTEKQALLRGHSDEKPHYSPEARWPAAVLLHALYAFLLVLFDPRTEQHGFWPQRLRLYSQRFGVIDQFDPGDAGQQCAVQHQSLCGVLHARHLYRCRVRGGILRIRRWLGHNAKCRLHQ